MSVENKVAIVTGSASGLGRASALTLGAHGATVVAADLDASGSRKVCDEVVASGGTAIAVECDVSDSASVARLVARAQSEFGRVDVLVHAAGICPRKPLLEMSDDEWHQVLKVNLDGSFYVTRDVGRLMAAQKSGTMILVTSDRGVHGSIDYAHYAASKGGTIALAKSLALTLGKHGVTVNGINPGLSDTPMGRAAAVQWQEKMALDVLGKASQPGEIADLVLFLAGTAGAFMTGQIVSVRTRYGA